VGRQLAGVERSPLGLGRTGHLERAAAGFAAIGCRADLAAVQALELTSGGRGVASRGPAS
jgi:hypothetical protein